MKKGKKIKELEEWLNNSKDEDFLKGTYSISWLEYFLARELDIK